MARSFLASGFTLAALLSSLSVADEPRAKATNDDAVERGLDFLSKDARKWKADHKCVSCHHAGLVVWALRESKQNGRKVDEPFLKELTAWIAESGDGKTGVPRPSGIPKALNAKAVWLALALGADPKPDAASRKGLQLFLKTVADDQGENGRGSRGRKPGRRSSASRTRV